MKTGICSICSYQRKRINPFSASLLLQAGQKRERERDGSVKIEVNTNKRQENGSLFHGYAKIEVTGDGEILPTTDNNNKKRIIEVMFLNLHGICT